MSCSERNVSAGERQESKQDPDDLFPEGGMTKQFWKFFIEVLNDGEKNKINRILVLLEFSRTGTTNHNFLLCSIHR